MPAEEAELFRENFKSFDTNGDGLICKKEFHNFFKSLKNSQSREYTDKQINLYVNSYLLSKIPFNFTKNSTQLLF